MSEREKSKDGAAPTIFYLSRKQGTWSEAGLYKFTGGHDGATPYGADVLDTSGDVFGTTFYGGDANGLQGYGIVFELR